MSSSSLINQIKLLLPDLPPSERKIGKFLCEFPAKVIYMNISELAEHSKSSSAAVVRFCKSIGMENFGNLKIRLSSEHIQSQVVNDFDLVANEPVSSIMEKILSNTKQVFEDTASQIDFNMVHKVVNMINEADVLYVYGVGASYLIAEDVAQKWRRIGKQVYATSDSHLLISTMSTGSQNAVLLGISYSGNTEEVLTIVEKAKNFGVKTIGLTRTGTNKISQKADAVLTTARAPEAVLRSAATTSRFAQLFVIDLVYMTYASKNYENIIEKLERSRKAISELHHTKTTIK